MSINMNDDKNIPTDTEAHYETVASQEEIYLEEVEEELRAILIFGDPTLALRGVNTLLSDANNAPCVVGSLDEQINHAAEELITCYSDDPPLSEEAVLEMLNDSTAQRLKSLS